ncbi:MAG: hypothetical protein ACXWLH_01070 [Candidatus Saccharimonadales bacterium]
MDKPTKKTDKPSSDKSSFLNSPTHLLVLIIVFLLLLVGGLLLKQHRNTKPTTLQTTSSSSPSLSLSSSQLKPQPGSEVSVNIWEDSGSSPINAVQADITYPIDSFVVVDIDGAKSAFEIQAQNSFKDGSIIVARGHKGNLTGRQFVATIKLKVTGKAGQTSLTFSDGSSLLDSTKNTNILNKTTGLNFTIGANQ